MADILLDSDLDAVTGAIEANLVEHFSSFSRIPRAQFYDGPDMTWVVTGIPRAVLNGVWRTDLPSKGLDAKIMETLSVFRARRVPMRWVCGPSTRPHDLGQHLERNGLAHVSDWTGMAVDLLTLPEAVPVAAGVIIEEGQDVRGLENWLRAYRASANVQEAVSKAFFELFAGIGLGPGSPVRHWVGSLNGEPVARTTLVLAAGVAGIHWVATAPEARRNGIASALVLEALHAARRQGFRLGVLHSSAMAVNAYRQLGFKEYCAHNVFVWENEDGSRA